MYLKSIISGIFISLAVVSFSANAIPVTGGVMELETGNVPLTLSATGNALTGQTGQMSGSHLGLDWLLVYTSPLTYELRNDNGVYSTGTYDNFLITEFDNSAKTSSTSGEFIDVSGTHIIDVTSEGTYTGSFGSGLLWRGEGTFTFLDAANPIDVPVPATIFLFTPALIGLLALRRRAKNSVA